MLLDSSSINAEVSGLLDFSQREVKRFIKELIEKVEAQRKYDFEASKVIKQSVKSGGMRAQRQTAHPQKDFSKVRPDRRVCYCQCTKHRLVNNCINCGKVICEAEGEGPCLFCGSWVDRGTGYDVAELGGE